MYYNRTFWPYYKPRRRFLPGKGQPVEVNAVPISFTLTAINGNELIEHNSAVVSLTLSTVATNEQIQLNGNVTTLTLATVEPVREVNYSIEPISLILSTVTSSEEKQYNQTPVEINLTSIAISREELYNVTPVSFTLSAIATNEELQTNTDVTILTLDTLAVGREELYNQTPIDLVLSIVNTNTPIQKGVDLVTINLSSINNSVEKHYDVTTLNLPLLIIESNELIQTSTDVISFTVSSVNAVSQLEYDNVPLNLVFSTLTPTFFDEINPLPAILTLSSINVYHHIAIVPEVLNLEISHNASFDPLIQLQQNQTSLDLNLSLPNASKEIQNNVEPITFILSTVEPTLPLHINVGALNLILSAITVTVIGGEAPSAVIVTTPERIEAKANIFAAFSEMLKFVEPAISEFVLEGTKFPYVTLSQVYNVLNWKNTCLERFEEGNYAVKVYTEDFIELETKIKEIENVLVYGTLLVEAPRKVISLQQVDKELEEIKRELYCGTLVYETIVQRTINQDYLGVLTSADTLNKCIFERSKLLKIPHNAFVSPGYVLENTKLPYIYVPIIKEEISWFNTKGRIDEVKYPITIKSEDLHELQDIMKNVEDVFDYAKFEIGIKEHLINEWVGTEIIEIEPQLWCGKINYEILVESEINEYNQ